MLKPKQIKYLKHHRGRKTGCIQIKNKKRFGVFCLQAHSAFWLTAKQLESTRRSILRVLKKEGKLWTLVFPQKSVTTRTVESRMGAGKGNVSHWVAVIKPGTIIFELSNISQILLKKVITIATQKLPIKLNLILASAL